MILSMFKSCGRFIWHFFVRPAPTSVALMVGPMPDAANDDHAQLLRRAMRAASQPEEMAPAVETIVAEPKLTIVPAALPNMTAAAEDDAKSAQVLEEFEDDPEGGINEETVDAALALTGEDAATADAEEMDLAEAAALEASPEPEERLDAANEDDAFDEPDAEAPADDEPTAVAADRCESGDFDAAAESAAAVDDVESDGVANDDAMVAAAIEGPSDAAEEPVVEVVRKVAQAPYVAALAELEHAVSGLGAMSVSADEDSAEADEQLQDDAQQAVDAAADDADDVTPADEPVTAAPSEEPAETDSLTEGEDTVAAAQEELGEEAPAKKTRKKRASSPSKKKSSTKTASRKGKAKVKDDVPAEPVPEDDVWVSDAVVWSLCGEWIDGEWHAPDDLDCPQRLEELRELAAEGRLTIWGRSDDAAVWQPIEAAYWKSGTVEPASLAEGRENVVAEPTIAGKAKSKRKPARKYSALKVSKSQIEEIWHPGAMH